MELLELKGKWVGKWSAMIRDPDDLSVMCNTEDHNLILVNHLNREETVLTLPDPSDVVVHEAEGVIVVWWCSPSSSFTSCCSLLIDDGMDDATASSLLSRASIENLLLFDSMHPLMDDEFDLSDGLLLPFVCPSYTCLKIFLFLCRSQHWMAQTVSVWVSRYKEASEAQKESSVWKAWHENSFHWQEWVRLSIEVC